MKRIDNLTEETKLQIRSEYENTEITVAEIASRYNIARSMVANIAVELGAQPRHEKAFGKRHGEKRRVCPKCRKTVDVKGARFCCYCGADIRNNIDILIERNQNLIKSLTQLPINERDEFRDVLIENIKVLQGVQK